MVESAILLLGEGAILWSFKP